MSVEERLLNLGASFADQVSKEDEDRFTAQVFARIGVAAPWTNGSSYNAEGAGPIRVGPSGGGHREGR
ncbi:hypothetical protein [Micromonospora sp. NPDC003241]